jgi:hypothetical protein
MPTRSKILGISIIPACRVDGPFWAVVLVLLSLILLNPMRINEDCALRIQFAEWVIEGKLPYVDFVDNTPPMATYLSTVPVLLSKFFSIKVILGFSLIILLLVVWSGLTIRKLLCQREQGIGNTELGIMLFAWGAFSLLMYKRGYFGEREHIFVLLFIPFLVVRWIRTLDGEIELPIALVTGFVAGIGTCIKPYFIFMAMIPEVYWFCRLRTPRLLLKPEVLAYVSAGLIFCAHFFILPEQVGQNFFGRWLPFINARYWVYNCDIGNLVLRRDFALALIATALPFLFEPRASAGLRSLARTLSLSTLGGLIVFLVQHKGFSYHLFPAIGPASLVMAIMIYESATTLGRRATTSTKSLLEKGLDLTCFLMFFAGVAFLVQVSWRLVTMGPNSYEETPLTRIISEFSEKGDSILVISPSVGDSYPMLLQMGRKPGCRFGNIFWIGMLYAGVSGDASGQFPYRNERESSIEEKLLLKELLEDIQEFQPMLIVIPNIPFCHGCPSRFGIQQYLTQNGFLEQVMKTYRPLTTTSGFAVFAKM